MALSLPALEITSSMSRSRAACTRAITTPEWTGPSRARPRSVAPEQPFDVLRRPWTDRTRHRGGTSRDRPAAEPGRLFRGARGQRRGDGITERRIGAGKWQHQSDPQRGVLRQRGRRASIPPPAAASRCGGGEAGVAIVVVMFILPRGRSSRPSPRDSMFKALCVGVATANRNGHAGRLGRTHDRRGRSLGSSLPPRAARRASAWCCDAAAECSRSAAAVGN